jgi:fructokinase
VRIGIDLGGTKTEGILMDAGGNILHRLRQPTPASDGYDAVLRNIVDLVRRLEAEAHVPCRIGIATPGAISPHSGLLRNSNTVCLNQMPVRHDLERLLARPIRIANDANCFALSEAIDGAGRDYRMVFGVIMGTGVGGGIVFNRNLHEGPQRIAGEWGHNALKPDGFICYCGRRGCVETCLSGPGLLQAYRVAGGGDAASAEAVIEAANAGDAIAEEIIANYVEDFGKAMATVVNILDPDAIVLGGGMSNIDFLYTRGKEALSRYVFSEFLDTHLLQNLHGDSGGVRGAAWLWATDEMPA